MMKKQSPADDRAYTQLRTVLNAVVDIPDVQWCEAVSHFSRRTFAKGSFLARDGAHLDRFYFITCGLVRFFYTTPDGQEHNKHFAVENGFAGSMHCFVLKDPCPFNIQALEQTHVVILPNCQLQQLLDQHPCWERLMRRQAENLVLLKERREREFLLNSLRVRYQHFLNEYPALSKRLPQYHIASYLGVTPVALSRIRKSLTHVNDKESSLL